MEAAGGFFWGQVIGRISSVNWLQFISILENCGVLLTPYLLGVWLLSGQARSSSELYLEVIASSVELCLYPSFVISHFPPLIFLLAYLWELRVNIHVLGHFTRKPPNKQSGVHRGWGDAAGALARPRGVGVCGGSAFFVVQWRWVALEIRPLGQRPPGSQTSRQRISFCSNRFPEGCPPPPGRTGNLFLALWLL